MSGAGNETTTRLIGWAGKVLAEHPDQRRALVEDRSLIPNAIEELLRYEPPAPHVGRYVARDVEFYGQTVPGAAPSCSWSAPPTATTAFEDPDRFDIHRDIGPHLTFGYGIHFCLGAALARLEGRVALDEVLSRFPEWDVDWSAKLSSTSTVRGWETLPVAFRDRARRRGTPRRRYDNTLRQARARRPGADRRRRRELLQGVSIRDWRAPDLHRVADRAGVNERTVYRHFANERGLATR